MNRRARRAISGTNHAAKLGSVINMDFGRINSPLSTEQVECGACRKHDGFYGIAVITEIQPNKHTSKLIDVLPLCEACFCADQKQDVLIRKLWKAPDLVIHNGGQASMEHILEIAAVVAEKDKATEH
jgi:hypothetical protein